MVENKAFASLSSGLLARKGAAKPAMRPQGFGSFGSSLEDLGWNDMGQGPASLHDIHETRDLPEHVPSSIEALTPAPGGRTHNEPPAVVEQRRELEARLTPDRTEPVPEGEAEPHAPEAEAPQESESRVEAPSEARVVKLPRSRAARVRTPAPAAKTRAKAAFTLRLDPERHFKLRLACALSRRSAQQLVTEALDDFLDSLPDLEALSGAVPGQAGQR